MKDRSSKRDRDHSTQKGGARGTEKDAGRFTGEGSGERGYRGRSAPDTPPGSVPGGSYGAGGGYSRGELPDTDAASEAEGPGAGDVGQERSTSESGDPDPDDEEEDLWRDAYGAYGFSRQDTQEHGSGMSGYGAQGFGAGERRGAQWGGGTRGGYGGGMPGHDGTATNDTRGSRGTAWGERGRPRRDPG